MLKFILGLAAIILMLIAMIKAPVLFLLCCIVILALNAKDNIKKNIAAVIADAIGIIILLGIILFLIA